MYEIKRAKRLKQALVNLVTARASLFTEHKISGLPMRTKYKHFGTICEQTFDNSPTDPISSSWWSSRHGVATLKSSWVVLFAGSQYRSTHFFATFHIVRPWGNVCAKFLRVKQLFTSSSRDFGFNHISIIVQNIFACLTFSLSAIPINMVKEWCRFSQIVFHEYFPHWVNVVFLSSQF